MWETAVCTWNSSPTSCRAKSHFDGLSKDQCHDIEKNKFSEYLKGFRKYYKNITREEMEEYEEKTNLLQQKEKKS